MPDIPIRIDGSRTFFGMDSFSDPQDLQPTEYVAAMNVVSRGGIVQTRPGSRVLSCAPSHDNLQGLHFFQPTGGAPHLVLACDGDVYVAPAPFTRFTQLQGIQFSPFAKYVSFATCLQSTDYDNDGALFALVSPRSVLVMQDGQTRAAYWDGSTARHLNPTQSTATSADGEIITAPGFDETKIGLWMAWSNNRLWVSREGQVFASDIGNPLKFTESQYIAEGRAFYLDDDCTGIVELTDQSGILVFTKDNATVIRSSITDRTQWLNTPDFQQVVLQQVGCVAPRSIIVQYGLIWWFSAKGVTALDAALRQNLTSKLILQDQEIIASKFNCSPDLSLICGSFFENYLLMSVPSGDVWNRHTWVLDQDPFPASGVNANSWNSWWSGWRPVQWARGIVDGNERLFFLSRDFDGKGRVWEAMTSDRSDNGCPITCALQTREHNFGDMELKRFKYAELYLKEVYGSVSFMAAYKSTKGPWTRVLTKQIEATAGQIYEDEVYSEDGNRFAGNRPQSRTIRTSETYVTDVPCQADCGVESDNIPAYIDHAFSLLMVWSGRAGVYGYRMFTYAETSDYLNGRCEVDEVAPRSVATNGAAALSFFTSCNPFPEFDGAGTFSADNPSCGGTAVFNATATSIISQTDADNKAACKALTQAQCYADGICGSPTFCNVEQTVNVSVDCGNGIRVCDGSIPVEVSCSSITGSASLCGISGYSSDEVPYDPLAPEDWEGQYRKWRSRELDGEMTVFQYHAENCENCASGQRRVYSGAFEPGCGGIETWIWAQRETTLTVEGCGWGTPTTDPDTQVEFRAPAGSDPCVHNSAGWLFATERTLTSLISTGCGSCVNGTFGTVGNPRASNSTAGQVSETLDDEQTPYAALLSGGGTPGTSCISSIEFAAFTEPESTSPIPFEGTAVLATFTIGTLGTPLTPGETYTASVSLTKTPIGGGAVVLETVSIEFVADSEIDAIEYVLPAEQGFEIQVTNVEVLAGEIPCEGSVSASFTVPANAYCAASQVQADQLAYNYAIQQATAAAQAQLSCIYGNEEQSFTDTCPGTLVDGGVEPPGAAIGNPVTVTIPAGTYTAASVAEANALALAEAQSQAESAIDCFWTNTEQTAEYCCEFIPDRCAEATVPFNTYNSNISQNDADTLAYAAALLEAEALIDCTSDTSDGGGEVIIV